MELNLIDLNNDMLQLIFDLLKQKTQRALRLTNSRFRSLISRKITFKTYNNKTDQLWKTANELLITNYPNNMFTVPSSNSLIKLTVKKVIINGGNNLLNLDCLPNLTYIDTNCIIDNLNNFKYLKHYSGPFTQSLPALESAELYLFQETNEQLDLPITLKSLQVGGWILSSLKRLSEGVNCLERLYINHACDYLNIKTIYFPSLTAFNCKNSITYNIDQLKTLTELEIVNLDIVFISQLINLKTLKYVKRNLNLITDLTYLTNLTILELNIDIITSDNLLPITIKELTVDCNSDLKILKLINLESLSFHSENNCNLIIDIQLPKLKKISINNINNGLIIKDNLSINSYLPVLEQFKAYYWNYLRPIRASKSIFSIMIHNLINIESEHVKILDGYLDASFKNTDKIGKIKVYGKDSGKLLKTVICN